MTTRMDENVALPMADTTVFCRRAGREFTAAEHADCAYCFGTIEDVATGNRGEFCDFRPGSDPREQGYTRPTDS